MASCNRNESSGKIDPGNRGKVSGQFKTGPAHGAAKVQGSPPIPLSHELTTQTGTAGREIFHTKITVTVMELAVLGDQRIRLVKVFLPRVANIFQGWHLPYLKLVFSQKQENHCSAGLGLSRSLSYGFIARWR